MIENAEITVVVQGPVQSLPDRVQDEGITHRCLRSVREILPGARIILSTWPDQELAGLDYDELVISDDPGPNVIGYRADGSPIRQNYNRQIVSSRQGLQRVATRYAMKLRADNYLTGDQFKTLQAAFPQRCADYRILRERVVVNNTFTRAFAKGLPVAFHLCDFFYFGLASDVLDIWDLELFADYPCDEARRGLPQYHGAPRFSPDATQYLWLRFLNKHLEQPISLAHLHDLEQDKQRISDICYANNLVIGAPWEIGLGLPSKFIGDARAASHKSLISYLDHTDWRRLYQRFCDPGHEIPGAAGGALRRAARRWIFLAGKRTEARLRLLKNRVRYALA